MLFLGKIEDLLNVNVHPDDNFNAALKTQSLMASNVPIPTECKDINNIQLNQGVYDDINMEVYDKEKTNDNIDNYTFPDIWNKYIVFHANFNNHNLAAGNFNYMIEEVDSLIIKKRPTNSVEQWLPIFEKKIYSETDQDEFNFIFTDYLVKNKQEYEYKLVPILKGGIEGLPIYATYEDEDHKAVNFRGIFICEPNSVYSTILDVKVTAQRNKPANIITTIGKKYPYVLCGTENNYYTGTVNGLFAPLIKKGEWNFENAWDFREKLNDFLLDGKTKLLKYYDGRMWLINIYDPVTNEEEEHEYKVITSFNWAEIGDVTDVYSLYDNGFISYNPYTKSPEIVDVYDYSQVVFTGLISDEKGERIEAAEIKLLDTDGNIINTTFSNTEGRFSFDKLRDDNYKIKISLDGYIPSSLNLSVINHKINVSSHYITLSKIEVKDNNEPIQPDNRNYYTSWKVLQSDVKEFISEKVYDNKTMPNSIVNTTSQPVTISFEAENFIIKSTDIILVSLTGSYQTDNSVPYEIFMSAGGADSSIELCVYKDDTQKNIICSSEFEICPSQLDLNGRKEITININKLSGFTGNLNIGLSLGELDNLGYREHLYPIITELRVYVNGKEIFKIGE